MKSDWSYRLFRRCILAFLVCTVLFPLLRLFVHIRPVHIYEVFRAPLFWPMVVNSAVTTCVASVISIVLAFAVALILNRTRIRYKSAWVMLFTIPMLIPSISHGMGLVLLFGDNGIISHLLGGSIGLYGYTGIIMGSVLYSFPVAFLLFQDSFQYEDFTVYESARVLGLSSWSQFRAITLPSMRQTLISAFLAVFTMIFTDYGVPLMTGGTVMTLPVYMYREVIGMMNFSGGAVVGILLLAPAVLAFLLDLKNRRSVSVGSTVVKAYEISRNPRRDCGAVVLLGLILFLLSMPIMAFAGLGFIRQYPVDMTFSLVHFRKLLNCGLSVYWVNSFAIALMTALIGTILSYYSAYVTARSAKALNNQILHFCSLLPLAIPGVVLGLAYAMSFHGLPGYSTIFILIVVNIVHFFSSPYLLAYNSFMKFNSNLEDVAATSGISRLKLLEAVYAPSMLLTVIEMYSYFFVNAMVTISAVSFLINFRTNTLALMIPQLESQSFIEGTALVSLMILVINLLEKTVAFGVRRYVLRHG